MKKYLSIILLFLIINGCEVDKIEYVDFNKNENLKIESLVGVRLENSFVEDNVKMNIKTKSSDIYYINITDIFGRIVSKSEIKVNQGDNILDLHTRALPISVYRIKLYDKNNNEIAVADFNKIK